MNLYDLKLRDLFALNAPADPWPEFEPVMPAPPVMPPLVPVGNDGEAPDSSERAELDGWRSDPCWDAEIEHPRFSSWVCAWRAYRREKEEYEEIRRIQRRIQWPYWYADQMMAERDRKR